MRMSVSSVFTFKGGNIDLQKKKQSQKRALFLHKSKTELFFGPSGETRTPGILLPNRYRKIFCIIFACFVRFPLHPICFPSLFESAVSIYSTPLCGWNCGQKRSPSFVDTFRRQGRGAFFIPLTAYIVTLKVGLGKCFLRLPCLRN